MKYSPWRMMTTVLAPVSLVTLVTSPSKTARALAPSVVAMSMPLLVTVTLLDTEEACLPYVEAMVPRSTGQGSLPLLLTKLVDRVFSEGVNAMPFSLVLVVVVAVDLPLLAFFLASALRLRSASALAFLISSAMMSSMAFWSFWVCCCLFLMSCWRLPSFFLSLATWALSSSFSFFKAPCWAFSSFSRAVCSSRACWLASKALLICFSVAAIWSIFTLRASVNWRM